MIGKSWNYIFDLAPPPRRTVMLQDKNIIIDVHRISKFLLHHINYSFFLLVKALRSRLK